MAASGLGALMGANLRPFGATFRLWAPSANTVSVRGNFSNWTDRPLVREADGYWFASLDGVKEGDEYLYVVDGPAGLGFKRDPYARALTRMPAYPDCNCIVTQPASFPWHDRDFVRPDFSDLVIYQLHVGACWSVDDQGHDRRADRPGRFLDLLERVDHLVELGINAVQLLPVQEFATKRSLGYNGVDLFSPEMDYSVAPTDSEFARYLDGANTLLARFGHEPLGSTAIDCQTKQLMVVIDIFHLHGISVIIDLVYNHAGGGFDEKSLFFLDRDIPGDNNRSLYFTDKGWAGGLVFAYWKQEVRQFLIDNAGLFLAEYHVDGFRFDEVTVIDRYGGWHFLQNLTDTLRYKRAQAPLIAEYWADQAAVLRTRFEGGAGFDVAVSSTLREAIRAVLEQARAGAGARLDLDGLATALRVAGGAGWRQVQHLENHDIVRMDNDNDRGARIPRHADPANPHSWYARGRSRVATGLLLTSPGIPMLFMGEEILEDEYWSDSADYFRNALINWQALATDRSRQDFFRFIRELLGLRRRLPALRAGAINIFHVHNDNRVIAYHRWQEGKGKDIIVVVNLSEAPWRGYNLGFPGAGWWRERFNSDTYEHWVNPDVQGNGGGVEASGPPLHGFSASADVVVPANGFVLFSR